MNREWRSVGTKVAQVRIEKGEAAIKRAGDQG